ncbi:hypothetical protein KIH86_04000 [Paenibacillus sp. HN-1]|uniref:hypothetical protein n=1 Tax=Paenibacillus TaxID=44249 RepID=UPI001CAA157E|nr:MULTISPECIES: hypothetical protein [Paenibacillus]MBY9082606.1 hypothetical protein [Paenibacillus sp. CGMCC 1.18879]MBY9083390.1 hypothetical protein [Paenibacillus sinensis]
MDTRKNIKATSSVKADLNAIQKDLGIKTESQAIAYLTAMYRAMKERKISLADHQEFLKASEEANRQASL